jgi:small subunit ribosomal protein S20
MCATMQKLRMREVSVVTAHPWYGRGETTEPAGTLGGRMANIKSQIKRNKQNEVRRERNKAVRSSLKTSQKKVEAAIADGDAQAAQDHAREASKALDKAASKGVVHKRTAARRKSRLARAANAAAN